MTTSVAELAFQCLQFEKEMRPTMSEILENLKEIRDWKEIYEKTTETNANNCSPESENLVLLKSGISFPCSTKSVTDLSFSSSKSSNSGSRENGGKYSSSTLELSTRIGHKLFLLS
ncbi:hypothetical protein M9H77_08384 [Catharanthus roseus]|uniref:Uncharacterized protein n=1 Tax=Catharanthus roseus TaxID=4058 RepID=A0ACC0BXM1_CATRO|nr:hypothetical protein M9H77_08384 [Catharanthus roseus]